MSEKCLLGLDPGGKGCFGWCVVKYSQKPPLEVIESGVADNAGSAVKAALNIIKVKDNELIGVAIDAPLFWHKRGEHRDIDEKLRDYLKNESRKNYDPKHANKIMQVNSLRGGCLMQGVMAARKIRDKNKKVPITESHPTAILAINNKYGHMLKGLPNSNDPKNHKRDAAIACLSAWAMITGNAEWEDRMPTDSKYAKMVTGRLHYYLPKFSRK